MFSLTRSCGILFKEPHTIHMLLALSVFCLFELFILLIILHIAGFNSKLLSHFGVHTQHGDQIYFMVSLNEN